MLKTILVVSQGLITREKGNTQNIKWAYPVQVTDRQLSLLYPGDLILAKTKDKYVVRVVLGKVEELEHIQIYESAPENVLLYKQSLNRKYMQITNKKEMTLAQIEKELGYGITIVK